jgi:predicted nucleic acid-binding protein
VTGDIVPAEAARLRTVLHHAASRWNLLRVDGPIIERARRPFPVEPLRVLDAIHLATALIAADDVPGLTMLTFDNRIRRAARQLGLPLSPA